VDLLQWVKDHSGFDYNQVLVNWYQDGNHYIGPHSDDETQLVPGSSIYSFSFGQERDFVVTSKKGVLETPFHESFAMKDNSLLIMEGDMQKNFKHQVPKRATSKVPHPRINITFRLFKKN
jgi:alkylated DNA repair dioxygenase AlkB